MHDADTSFFPYFQALASPDIALVRMHCSREIVDGTFPLWILMLTVKLVSLSVGSMVGLG